jgi:GntR family transcriptional regulator, phosphonate transport system regulatory protein
MTLPRTPIWKSIAGTLADEIARGHWAVGERLPTEAELSPASASTGTPSAAPSPRWGTRGSFTPAAGRACSSRASPQSTRSVAASASTRTSVRRGGFRERRFSPSPPAPPTPRRPRRSTSCRGWRSTPTRACRSPTASPSPPSVQSFRPRASPTCPATCSRSGPSRPRLPRGGVPDYTRASTRLTAVAATATQALHLRLPEGAPLLRSVGINVDGEGRPVEYGHTWFAGDRVTLTVGSD